MKDRAAIVVACASLCLAGAALVMTPAASAQSGKGYKAPRTVDGKPDFEGIWQARNTAQFDLEDHNGAFGIRAGRTVIVDPADGKIPYTPAARAKRNENFENRKKLDPNEKCFLAGVPRTMYMPYPFQIFQNANYVMMLSEYVHTTRTIFMQGQHPELIPIWMGDSRGKWEGETLVVDVTNNQPDTWFDMSGNFHSEDLHMTERWTRTEPDVLTYEVTFEDPKVFTRPWKISMPIYQIRDKNAEIFEYECHAYLEDEEARAKRK
jgi:hypothetical protein